jgi:fatty acid desaturase
MMIQIKNLREVNNWKAVLALTRDWSAIILITLISIKMNHWLFYIFSVYLIGIFQFALGESMIHEAAHYHLFRPRRLNYYLEIFYGLPLFITVAQFQEQHQHHHAQLGQTEDHLIKDYRCIGLFKENPNLVWLWFIKPLIGFSTYYFTLSLTLRPWREGIKIVIFWLIVLSVCFYFQVLHLLLWYWIIPFLLVSRSLLYWSEVADHYNTVSGTRSRLNRISNWLTHNNGYHYIHHRYPSIPWFHLPQAHQILSQNSEDVGDISYGFFDTFRQLKQKLPPEACGFPALSLVQQDEELP